MSSAIRLEKSERIATITLDRPEKRNPINEAMLAELETVLQELRDDASTRVVILTATGPSFCAGADLSIVKGVRDEGERQRIFAEARRHRIRLIARTFTLLESLEQVSIAAINGHAAGGGFGLALACDFRFAISNATFWFPEVDLGVPLSLGATARLFSMVGAARAKEIILTCDRYSAKDLHHWGAVNRIVPSDQLRVATRDFAKQLMAKSPKAVTSVKLTVNRLAAVAAREMGSIDPETFIHRSES